MAMSEVRVVCVEKSSFESNNQEFSRRGVRDLGTNVRDLQRRKATEEK